MSGKNYYGKTSTKRILTGTEDMQELNYLAMKKANDSFSEFLDWSILSVYRTEKEQYSLFSKGRNSEGFVISIKDVVTNCDGVEKLSIHQSGDATDFVPLDGNGRADWNNKGAFALVACCYFEAAKELGLNIRWGGHFKGFYDGGHIEIVR